MVFGLISGCQDLKLNKSSRVMMGTYVEVTSAHKEAAGIVFAEIKRIEGLLSKYDPESEVSELNRTGELRASPETFYVIKKAKEFWKASSGAFDITVGPLMDLWGFTDKVYVVPEPQDIQKTLQRVGFDKILLNEADNVVKFSVSGLKIDLGAIAKGYALDCCAKKLKEKGIGSCLINAGGQVLALGENSGRPWKIGIRHPRKKGASGCLELKDKCVSTSGDYEQFFSRGSRRYAHIMDPKTGYPAGAGVSSLTVVADDGLTADALSTAIFVLGKEKGAELVKKFPGAKIIGDVPQRDTLAD